MFKGPHFYFPELYNLCSASRSNFVPHVHFFATSSETSEDSRSPRCLKQKSCWDKLTHIQAPIPLGQIPPLPRCRNLICRHAAWNSSIALTFDLWPFWQRREEKMKCPSLSFSNTKNLLFLWTLPPTHPHTNSLWTASPHVHPGSCETHTA